MNEEPIQLVPRNTLYLKKDRNHPTTQETTTSEGQVQSFRRYQKEYDEIDAYARALHVNTPEPDSIVAVVQMLRQRQQEALREAGQMTLI